MDENVKVAVRCRPLSRKEVDRGCSSIVDIVGKSIKVRGSDSRQEEKTFTFDYVYGVDSIQQTVYHELGRPVVTQALDGFNGTIFAYGQTGSGKTHSMMGNDENPGIIPQLNDDLWVLVAEKFQQIDQNAKNDRSKTQYLITVSFLEVYNEEVKDLLNPSDKKLNIRESPTQGIFVEGLAELVVRDASEVLRLIYQGNAVRHVGATQMNDQSSRSHSVFTLKIEQKIFTAISESKQREQMIRAKVNLVDLAGSERADKTGATGQTLKEGAKINQSLLTLSTVINKLSEGAKKGQVIPYRDSKLTRLLQESLGGNAKTVMIAAVSPADYNYLETVSTLKYANRAKSIENAVSRNEDSSERMIRDLQKQIEDLKAQLQGNIVSGTVNPELEQKLREMEQQQHDTWEEKERLSRELEAQRQENMNSVISQMMQSVKEQKVVHMKNIKRLTNEKAMLQQTLKKDKEESMSLKQSLDENIAKYQKLQATFDTFSLNDDGKTTGENEEEQRERERQAEALANEMIPLLTKIDQDRQKFTEKKQGMNLAKQRLNKIEVEITEERGELVATAGILNQNDKIREQIQQEERQKLQEEFEKELADAKDRLEKERLEVRENINSELQGEMEKLRTEIKMLQSLKKIEENKNLEWNERYKALHEYADDLEGKLADSLATQETLSTDCERLAQELQEKTGLSTSLQEENESLSTEASRLRREMQEQQERMVAEHRKMLEDSKFDIFAKMMDQLQEERKMYEARHAQTQKLLAQATQDIMHLAAKNAELEIALQQAILYEPPIK
eukprot:gene10142-7232_t